MSQDSELNVLLIEDEPDAAMLVEHVLTRSGDSRIALTRAGDLRTGLECLAERDFQAILLDLNLPDSRGFDTFTSVRRSAPDRAVIVLTGHEDEALALQAVRGGADEYLIKSDIRDRFLLQRIRHAVERNRLKRHDSDGALKSGRILTFIGAKGGVGTTTLVVNLAAALAGCGKSAIALELATDYGSFAAMLNHVPLWDLSTLLRGGPETISRDAVCSCLEEFSTGFRTLCGPVHGGGRAPVSPGHARALLGVARTQADFTIVDLPSGSTPLIQEVIQHSTSATMVVERNRLGLHAAMAKIKDLQALAANSAKVNAILVNKTPFTEFLSPAEFGKRLGCAVLGVVPPATDLYGHGETESLPVLGRPESGYAQSMQELARRLSSPRISMV